MGSEAKVGNTKATNKTISFLRGVKAELKNITWPTKEDVIKSTQLVLGYMVLLALIVSVYDSIFHKVLSKVLSFK